jgi:hypothetical protein
MVDVRSAGLIHAKGGLILVLGTLASAVLVVRSPSPTTALLVGVAVWAYARFYYYAFYVVERDVDPTYRYSGLGSLIAYWIRQSRGRA